MERFGRRIVSKKRSDRTCRGIEVEHRIERCPTGRCPACSPGYLLRLLSAFDGVDVGQEWHPTTTTTTGTASSSGRGTALYLSTRPDSEALQTSPPPPQQQQQQCESCWLVSHLPTDNDSCYDSIVSADAASSCGQLCVERLIALSLQAG